VVVVDGVFVVAAVVIVVNGAVVVVGMITNAVVAFAVFIIVFVNWVVFLVTPFLSFFCSLKKMKNVILLGIGDDPIYLRPA